MSSSSLWPPVRRLCVSAFCVNQIASLIEHVQLAQGVSALNTSHRVFCYQRGEEGDLNACGAAAYLYLTPEYSCDSQERREGKVSYNNERSARPRNNEGITPAFDELNG